MKQKRITLFKSFTLATAGLVAVSAFLLKHNRSANQATDDGSLAEAFAHSEDPKLAKKGIERSQNLEPMNIATVPHASATTSKAKEPSEVSAQKLDDSQKAELTRRKLEFVYRAQKSQSLREIDFCAELQKGPHALGTEAELYNRSADSQFDLEHDPSWVAMNGPLYELWDQPASRELLDRMMDDKNQNFMNSPEAVKMLIKAIDETVADRQKIIARATQYYYLLVLTKAVAQKPEILRSESFRKNCETLNSSLHQNSKPDKTLSQGSIEDLLKEAKIDFGSVGYSDDLAKKTQVNAHYSRSGHVSFSVNSPWASEDKGEKKD